MKFKLKPIVGKLISGAKDFFSGKTFFVKRHPAQSAPHHKNKMPDFEQLHNQFYYAAAVELLLKKNVARETINEKNIYRHLRKMRFFITQKDRSELASKVYRAENSALVDVVFSELGFKDTSPVKGNVKDLIADSADGFTMGRQDVRFKHLERLIGMGDAFRFANLYNELHLNVRIARLKNLQKIGEKELEFRIMESN